MENLTKNRLKRSSFLHESKRLARVHQATIPTSALPLSSSDLPQPWNEDHKNLQIFTTIPYVTSGDSQNNTARCTLTLAMIAELYPEEAWIHAYTDGLATNAVADGLNPLKGTPLQLGYQQGRTAQTTQQKFRPSGRQLPWFMTQKVIVPKLSSSQTRCQTWRHWQETNSLV
jgi:hypothetical protein